MFNTRINPQSSLFVLLGLAIIFSAFPVGKSHAAQHGAFAYSNNTVRWGTAWGYNSLQAARNAAIANCGANDCTIRHDIPPGQCFAVVHGNPGHVSWGWGSTKQIARQAALNQCVRDGNTKCEVPSGNASLFCNASHRPPPPPPPPPSTGGFTVLHGYDLYGGDYYKLPGRVSYNRCMSACRRDGRCRAFTFNTNVSACFLKSYVPNQSPFNGAISGIKN